MEDIEENNPENVENVGDEIMEGEDDTEKVMTVEAKMGSEEGKIREVIHEVYLEFAKENPEIFDEDEEPLKATFEKISQKIASRLVEKQQGVWNVIVGKRISVAIALLKPEKYASYKIGKINVIVFELK